MNKDFAKFLDKKEYSRFTNAWVEKYKSLGHLGGSIEMMNLSKEEKEHLSILLSMPIENSLKISYQKFKKQLQGTKYESIDFLEVLNILHGKISTNSQKKIEKDIENKNKKEYLYNLFQGTKSYEWLEATISQVYLKDTDLITYETVCKGLNNLPSYHHEFELLPVFSNRICGNPHYFDKGIQRELLLKGIDYIFSLDNFLRDIENVNQILYAGGLLKDDLSNYCYICHIMPKNSMKWKYLYDAYEPWNVNLYNILHDNSEYIKTSVLIVENPSVFRDLSEYIKINNIQIGLICSNGQINLCTYLLLDYLENSGCKLYYCGDLDPEGLLIAQKLLNRYPSCQLWNYEIDYKKYGNRYELISDKRIESLKKLTDNLLASIGEIIENEKIICYQEALIDLYKRNIHELI